MLRKYHHAYRKDLTKFSAYAGDLDWKDIDHVFIPDFSPSSIKTA